MSAQMESPLPTKKRDAALIYAENRLKPWAKWAADSGTTLSIPRESAFNRAMGMFRVGIQGGSTAGRLTAYGAETRRFRPLESGDPPDAVIEVECAVIHLPVRLKAVLNVEFFVYGPIEVKARALGMSRARYSSLLEAAKYSIFVMLS